MICIIPARKNSKGLKNKNLININGKPLIEYTIKFALSVNFFKNVYISTDDERIISRYKNFHKKLKIIKRDKKLATDKASIIDVYRDFINTLMLNGELIDQKSFCSMLATSPLRNMSVLKKAYNKFNTVKPYSLISVNLSKPEEWIWKKNKKGFVTLKSLRKFKNTNRQSYIKSYVPNGNFYFFDIKKFIRIKKIINKKSLLFEIKKKFSHDIDDYDDLKNLKKIL